jgi:chemotaxis protein MotB
VAGHRRKKHVLHDEHPDERWLLTYADMITLLVALFIVLWSISSVNNSKLDILKQTLQDAFDGAVVSGGKAAFESASTASADKPTVVAQTVEATAKAESANDAKLAAQKAEDDRLEELKSRVDAAARARGLEDQVRTEVTARGLRIRLLTDRILFESGDAVLKSQGGAIVDAIAGVLRTEHARPIQVDGHTDAVPLSGGRYEDNWLLSSARAAAVVRRLQADGFNPRRLAAGGLADNKPLASNDTEAGRAQNRRVELLLARLDSDDAP